jgi:hypothetical protein
MVKRKIILCSESLRLERRPARPDEKFSVDGKAIIGLLKNHIEALRAGRVEIEAIGFGGKSEFMKHVPSFVESKFAEYRHQAEAVEIFIIALRDSDTCDDNKISEIRSKLKGKIQKFLAPREFKRVHIKFAVQAIEAWVLADEKKLNEYLKVSNKVKHENDPEMIKNPKAKLANYFMSYLQREYRIDDLLQLFPALQPDVLLRCKHFKEFYKCVENICNAAQHKST